MIAGQGLIVAAAFWLGLTVGYRVKLRRASRLEWPERPWFVSPLWTKEFEDDQLIEFASLADWRAGIPQFRLVARP